jgi:hypothetical protein
LFNGSHHLKSMYNGLQLNRPFVCVSPWSLRPDVTAAVGSLCGSVHVREEKRVSFVTTQPGRVAIAVGCVLVSAAAGCSSRSPGSTPSTPASTSAVAPLPAASAVAPLPAASAVQDESIPGIGATRANWDDSHTPNAANDNGSVYGDDPSLPEYLTPSGAVYSYVDDRGTGRIQSYNLNMHTIDPNEVLPRVRQELPSDATVAWDLLRDKCYRVAFNSPTLQAAGHYMAKAQLQYIQEDGTLATSPRGFNVATLWLDEAGSPPDREADCD